MDHTPRTAALAALLLAPLVPLTGCSEEPEPEPAPALDTSYLESLENETAPRATRPAARTEDPAPTPAPPPERDPESELEPESEPEPEPEPERELRAQRESGSTLGRTRDMARDIRTQAAGGRDVTLADVGYDEMWIGAARLRFDVPEPWQIAIPDPGTADAMAIIESRLGNAEVVIRTFDEGTPPATILQELASTITSDTGGRVRVRAHQKTIAGLEAHRAAFRGTLLAPHSPTGREQPFHAIDAAVFVRPGHPAVLISLGGISDTVDANMPKWEALLESAREQ